MRKQRRLYILLVLVILLAACIPTPASQPAASNLPLPQPQPQAVATTVEKVATMIPASESTTGPQPTTPVLRAMNDQGQQEAVAHLRSFLGKPELELTFKGLEHSPNATNQPAALFMDGQGNSYYISQYTLQPIEFTLSQPIPVSQPKSADELRAVAQQFAKDHSTKFLPWSDKLKYTEGNKGGENSFFRWEAPGTDVGGMPATLQIGLKQDGTLFAYLNSLDFLP